MIRYPEPIGTGQTIGVTATSSGVESELHHLLRKASHQFELRGYTVLLGETVWTNEKLTSAPKEIRYKEFIDMMNDDTICAVIPPWGGHFLSEILPLINYDELKPKWTMGYSDTSTILLTITLLTGIATVHGTNFVDLRSDEWDPVTSKFLEVLKASKGDTIVQHSSEKFQSEWNHFAPPDPYVFQLDTETAWMTIGNHPVRFEGRLLTGCIDTIRHLIGTPFGDVKKFREKYVAHDSIIWALENCEMDAADFYRSILQMHNAGWLDNTAGIIFGRTAAGIAQGGFSDVDAMERLSNLTGIPIVYNADIGHMPPQMTFVNGAYAEIEVAQGKAVLKTKLI